MKFLANENFPNPSIELLRSNGYQIESISEVLAGISDPEVLRYAHEHNLVILTFDRDYGEMVYKYGMRDNPGIIYFRVKGTHPQFAGMKLLEILNDAQIPLLGLFTVVDMGGIRQRKLTKDSKD